MPERIIVVSNRLPVTIHPGRDAPNDVEQSSGGLVSALRRVASVQSEELVWIGWPGCTARDEAEEKRLATRLAQESSSIKLVPVWLSPTDVEDFYNGFSNSSLWPLLHWMTPYARFKRAWFEAYRRVNERFADVVLSTATPQDLVWVQDYHLFLLPQMLRRRRELSQAQNMSLHSMVSAEEEVHTDGAGGDDGEQSPVILPERPQHLPPPIEDPSLSFDPPARPRDLPQSPEVPVRAVSSSVRHEGREAGESGANSGNDSLSNGDGLAFYDTHRSTAERSVRQLRIAFFLHTPFPPYEVICVLPQCQDVIEGVLGADIVGFHTYSYLRHFRSCVVRLCGLTTEIDQIDYLGHRSRLGVFPIGANWQDITEAMETEQFSEHLGEYTKQFEGKSLVLSVERLDYSKGMPQKLTAIERYLEQAHLAKRGNAPEDELTEDRTSMLEDLQKRFRERNTAQKGPRLGSSFSSLLRSLKQRVAGHEKEADLDHAKTVFIFIAVPSRQAVQEYQAIEEEVHRSVSTINGRFSTPTHQPIIYIHRSVPMEELAALYARADCCLVTPLIDGMNLVAKEYIAAKDRNVANVVPGTIVLSELAGAAQELFDSIVVNPYDEDQVANAIAVGLELVQGGHLDEDLRWEVTGRMRESILQNDSVCWARTLLNQLKDEQAMQVPMPQESYLQRLPDSAALAFGHRIAGIKALFLDYDGTLREFAGRPEEALPSEDAKSLFAALDEREDLRVFIVSGRKQDFLEETFRPYRSFTLIAEHGYVKRGPDTGHEWRTFNPYTSTEWMSKVMPIMQLYERCTPGAHIEAKLSAIVWHYRECDEEYGQFKAKELVHQLALSLGNLPCEISQGHKIVEVSSLQVKKGPIVRNACLAQSSSGLPFVQLLCMGDDKTDESMFLDAPQGAWTVKVGDGETYAKYGLKNPKEVRRFLSLIVADRPSPRHSGHHPGQLESSSAENSLYAAGFAGRDAFKSCHDAREGRDAFKSCDVRQEATALGDGGDDMEDTIDLPEFETEAS